jgi:parallel beta-helix repeat protein
MRRIRILFCFIIYVVGSAVLFSCGGGSAGAGPPVTSHPRTIGIVYVDAATGDDVNGSGSPGNPYRTITGGLKHAAAGESVYVMPGTYDASIGESFPITLVSGVSLVGLVSSEQPDIKPKIQGAGNYTSPSQGGPYLTAIICADGADIDDFEITAPGGIAVWCEAAAARTRIRENVIKLSDYGIVTAGTARPAIENNVITENFLSGIETLDTSAPLVRNTTLSSNGYGVVARDSSLPDLGAPTKNGANILTENTECDLYNVTDSQISAIGNTWDDNPLLFTATNLCTNGANVVNEGLGAVLFRDVPVSDDPIFADTDVIIPSLPGRNEILTTLEPRFMWTPSGSKYVFLALFQNRIKVVNGSISNGFDAIWAWHSGLGKEGDIRYGDGIVIAGGVLMPGSPLPVLAKGKTYYWAVWAWDDKGVKIVRSSKEMYFTIANY